MDTNQIPTNTSDPNLINPDHGDQLNQETGQLEAVPRENHPSANTQKSTDNQNSGTIPAAFTPVAITCVLLIIIIILYISARHQTKKQKRLKAKS